MYFANHADVPVTAGECYWIEIKNDVGDPDAMGETSSWFWNWAATQDVAPLYEGNGRMAIDGSPPDGYDNLDVVGATDLAFCLGMELSTPTCGLQTLFNTGPEHITLSDSIDTWLGWSSGNLCLNNSGGSVPCDDPTNAHPERRTAQAFSLGPVSEGPGTDHRIRHIYVDGFEPDGGELNEDLNVEIFSRTDLVRPTEADSLFKGSFPFEAIIAVNNPEGGFPIPPLHYLNVDLALPPGDYWLTVWASNNQLVASNFAWFTNAHNGIKVTCPPVDCIGPPPEDAMNGTGCNPDDCAATAGKIVMWRSRHFPDGAPLDPIPGDGFGFGTVSADPNLTLAWNAILDPDGSPDNLLNTSFQVRGGSGGSCGNSVVEPGEECELPDTPGCNSICRIVEVTCPWDCDGSGDGFANVADLLQLLAEYDILSPVDCTGGTEQCDYNGDGCVDVVDLLKLLSHYSLLPDGSSCPQ